MSAAPDGDMDLTGTPLCDVAWWYAHVPTPVRPADRRTIDAWCRDAECSIEDLDDATNAYSGSRALARDATEQQVREWFTKLPKPPRGAHLLLDSLIEKHGWSREDWDRWLRGKEGVRKAKAAAASGADIPLDAVVPVLALLDDYRRPAPPFPLSVFDAEWSQWISDTAEGTCAPVDYVAAPLLSLTSTLLGNARWVQVHPRWQEPPHLWTGSVGDSGTSKTPAGQPLLRDVVPVMERRMRGDFDETYRAWCAVAEDAKAKEDAWKRAVKEAHNAGGAAPPRPADSLAPAQPQPPRIVMSDVTIEKLAMTLAAAPKGVLMMRDELAGFLIGMDNYNSGARPFWLEAFGGGYYRVERVKHPDPIVIDRLAVGWWGGIQPARLDEVLKAPDDGLVARFLWFWPDRVPFRLSWVSARTDWAITALDRLSRLEMVEPTVLNGEETTEDVQRVPVFVPFHPNAINVMEKFGKEMEAKQAKCKGLLNSVIGKARGHMARIALSLEYLWWCAKTPHGAEPACVSEAAAIAAAMFMREYAVPMAERVLGDAGAASDEEKAAHDLAKLIVDRQLKEVHPRTLLRMKAVPRTLRSAATVRAAAGLLEEAGWVFETASVPGNQQKSRIAWLVNPALWPALDARDAGAEVPDD